MQKATSILSPAKSNLVITFEHFSGNFKFDLCHDFSFWKAETGRCIPKEMFDETGDTYQFTPLCNRTEHSEHATLKVVLIGSHRSTSIVGICSDDRFLCQ